MSYLNKTAILSSLTHEDIIKICSELGHPEYKEDSQGNLCFSTALCHGGDSPYKLIYYDNKDDENGYGRFHCYTCGDTFDIIELVIRAKRQQGINIVWGKALYFVGKTTNKLILEDKENENSNSNIVNDIPWLERLKKVSNKRTKSIPTLTDINENILDLFYAAPHEEWLKDNISALTMNTFEIMYYGLTDQIVIPHRDINDRLVGIRGRYLDSEDQEKIGKYAPMQIEGKFLSHQLGANLYGLFITKEAINRKHKIMLVEAEKSVLQGYTYYGDDCFCAATCGSAITHTQIKIILSLLNVDEVIWAPDRDYEKADSWDATIWYNKQVLKLAPLVPYIKCSLIADNKNRLGYKDSPTDNGKEILEELLEEKITITMEEVNRVLNENRLNR